MTTLTNDERIALRGIVLSYFDLVERYRTRLYPGGQPERGSKALSERQHDRDWSDSWSERPVSLAHGSAEMHMRAAQDQGMGVAILLGSNLDDSIMTVARGAIEAFARAAWLLDDSLDARGRVSRCMTERANALVRQAATNKKVGRDLDTADRLSNIRASAARHGFSFSDAARSRGPVVGTAPFPGQTAIVEQLFSGYPDQLGLRAYADLSAAAHSTLAAFAEPSRPVVVPVEPGSGPESDPPPDRFVILVLAALDVAFTRYMSLYGWNQSHWRQFISGAHSRLRPLFGAAPSALDIIRLR